MLQHDWISRFLELFAGGAITSSGFDTAISTAILNSRPIRAETLLFISCRCRIPTSAFGDA
jgi:hypothetical protein